MKPLFKTATIAGHDVLLRSIDGGKTWFSAPGDMLATKRRREQRFATLKRWWREQEIKEEWTYGIPENCLSVGVKI